MISVFFLGFLFSFLGYTPPSVLNMTALQIRLNGNQKEFSNFTLGVSIIVFLQAYVSIYLTAYIHQSPTFLIFLEKAGIVVLLLLSLYFYKQNKKEKKITAPQKKSKKSFFLKGVILSALNMFAIPFFCGMAALLMTFNFIHFDTISVFLFVVGSVIGIYFILFLYGKFAHKIQQKTGNLTNNINLVLCFITAGFALFTMLKFII
ncbi:LysE family transporter [Polaribacter cellanae]|uniref:LysE family transporter n=1 Tax=Polaribacter cellanae TaxID=2818493 RepID=A0A975CLF1_9FLAO|nr:LysE family transporter [Polaribacter cellanae]QTE21385.1 LysE family transporter [Polaribacter cellanae]